MKEASSKKVRGCGHVSVLLRKDVLTLKRNWSFLMMFFVLPLSLMMSFTYLHDILAGEPMPEQHNFWRK